MFAQAAPQVDQVLPWGAATENQIPTCGRMFLKRLNDPPLVTQDVRRYSNEVRGVPCLVDESEKVQQLLPNRRHGS